MFIFEVLYLFEYIPGGNAQEDWESNIFYALLSLCLYKAPVPLMCTTY